MFERTICDCADCRACCTRQPGSLAPGDLERIAQHLGLSVRDASQRFVASPGALVGDSATGRVFRIGTITPDYDVARQRCVFLDDQQRCTIHAVAPAGCSLFDTHMDDDAARPRSAWLARQQMNRDYQWLRATLRPARVYRPLPLWSGRWRE